MLPNIASRWIDTLPPSTRASVHLASSISSSCQVATSTSVDANWNIAEFGSRTDRGSPAFTTLKCHV